MKVFWLKITTWVKAHKVWTAVIVLVLLGAIMLSGGDKEPVIETTIVEKTTVEQVVDITGQVVAATDVDLAFERTGKVIGLTVRVGDEVRAGQILATQSNADLAAQLQQAVASAQSSQALVDQYQSVLDAQRATLEEVEQGARPEQITIAQTKVTNAQKALTESEENLASVQHKAESDLAQVYEDIADVLHDAFTDADDAVNRLLDPHFSNDNTANPELTFVTANLSVGSLAESQRIGANSALDNFQNVLLALPESDSGRIAALAQAQGHLETVRDFMTTMTAVMVEARGLDSTTLNTYRSNVATGRGNVNTALTSLTTQLQLIDTQEATNSNKIATAEISLTTAKNALTTAQKDLALTLAGSTPQEISAQQATVAQAEANVKSQEALLASAWANVANMRAQISKTIIKSPIDGIITKEDLTIGEVVTANEPVIGIIANTEFEIEAFVPEVDIAKIVVDDVAQVTLDAYGSDTEFTARVISTDLSETEIEGLATYRVRLQFEERDSRIRSGMTANVEVDTDKREDVFAVPQRAVIREGITKYVQVLHSNGEVEKREVTTGLRGSDGLIEIMTGIAEGEQVITFIEE